MTTVAPSPRSILTRQMSRSETIFKNNVEVILSHFPLECQRNPRMMTSLAKCCLHFKYDDVEKATECLSHYISWREKLFGNLDDQNIAEDSKLAAQLKSGFFRLSPVRLNGGESLIHISMKHHDPNKFDTNDTIKCFHFFLINALARDPTLARRGFVLLNNMSDVHYHNLDMNFPVVAASCIGHSIPIRLCKIIIFNPIMVIRYAIPLIQAVLPAKLQDRMAVVAGACDVHNALSIQTSQLPVEIGGDTHDCSFESYLAMIEHHPMV
jgi:hypothetical protein